MPPVAPLPLDDEVLGSLAVPVVTREEADRILATLRAAWAGPEARASLTRITEALDRIRPALTERAARVEWATEPGAVLCDLIQGELRMDLEGIARLRASGAFPDAHNASTCYWTILITRGLDRAWEFPLVLPAMAMWIAAAAPQARQALVARVETNPTAQAWLIEEARRSGSAGEETLEALRRVRDTFPESKRTRPEVEDLVHNLLIAPPPRWADGDMLALLAAALDDPLHIRRALEERRKTAQRREGARRVAGLRVDLRALVHGDANAAAADASEVLAKFIEAHPEHRQAAALLLSRTPRPDLARSLGVHPNTVTNRKQGAADALRTWLAEP